MFEGFLEASVGAVIGFLLAQIINAAKIFRDWYKRPKLIIRSRGENWLLEPTERHTIYGFSLHNAGRSIATGVQVQLVKVIAQHDENKHCLLSENAYDLFPYRRETRENISVPLTLVPGAAVDIQLASRNDHDDRPYEDVIYPSVSEIPELFEETATGATAYMYTVVAFDDKANFAQETLSLR